MQRSRIKAGTDYAASWGSSRPRLGSISQRRVRIVDTTLAYLPGDNGPIPAESEQGQRLVKFYGSDIKPGMLAEHLDDDGNGYGARLVVHPAQVGGTWAEHVAEADRSAQAHRDAFARDAAKRVERSDLDVSLREAGVSFTRGDYDNNWTLSEADVRALLALLADR